MMLILLLFCLLRVHHADAAKLHKNSEFKTHLSFVNAFDFWCRQFSHQLPELKKEIHTINNKKMLSRLSPWFHLRSTRKETLLIAFNNILDMVRKLQKLLCFATKNQWMSKLSELFSRRLATANGLANVLLAFEMKCVQETTTFPKLINNHVPHFLS